MNRPDHCIVPPPDRKTLSGNREKILMAALRLFTEQGVDATPTAQISKEAGISTGTLFHYFPDKNSLIDQLYLSLKKELSEAIRLDLNSDQTTRQRIEHCLRGYISWGIANPEKIHFLDQCYNSPGIGDAIKNQAYSEFTWMLEIGDSAIREGILENLPFEFHAVMISRIIGGILALIESGKTGMAEEEIIEKGIAMFWKR